ncbi:hypothetical protein Pst134EA_001046 [Puccinia striiformis f. sp. tritici]|uniref:hypothetical protein n=1 Tax=Puccinia striiformis f. sp. tritici TaxID=168172 RepID=UPI0020079C00|nr:hypothetical protein Pst134EA_001046 [Puccinia striiformis f. sp. tritici]KAH9473991.1 hypothetical protein Pst134EA_001046 [Puccinia striiformis f. sp. tritici]
MSFPIIHSTGSVPDHGSMIFPQVAAAARDAGQPTETLALPDAIDRTTHFGFVGNTSVNGTNTGLTTDIRDTSTDTVMVNVSNLSLQPSVLAPNIGAPGNNALNFCFERIVSPSIGEAIDTAAHHTAAHDPIRNARVSFVEDLEEELPPAYEEHAPANSRRLPYVLDTPPPAHRTRWIGRDSYRPRAPFQNHTREATYIDRRPRSSSSRIRRPSNRSSSVARNRTQAPNRRPLPPASARSYMSSSSSSPSPPSSPLPTMSALETTQ